DVETRGDALHELHRRHPFSRHRFPERLVVDALELPGEARPVGVPDRCRVAAVDEQVAHDLTEGAPSAHIALALRLWLARRTTHGGARAYAGGRTTVLDGRPTRPGRWSRARRARPARPRASPPRAEVATPSRPRRAPPAATLSARGREWGPGRPRGGGRPQQAPARPGRTRAAARGSRGRGREVERGIEMCEQDVVGEQGLPAARDGRSLIQTEDEGGSGEADAAVGHSRLPLHLGGCSGRRADLVELTLVLGDDVLV